MQDIQEVKKELTITQSIKSLVLAYEEISIIRIQKIRNTVLNTRYFLDELSKIFEDIHAIYASSIYKLFSKKQDLSDVSFSTLDKNGKILAVLITPNARLSGNLSSLVTGYFIEAVTKSNVDVLVIGKVGRKLVDQFGLKNYYYYDLPKRTDQARVYEISEFMMRYNKVIAFFGKFKNLLKRVSSQEVITGNSDISQKDMSQLERYIFEPSIDKILNFFEVQIFSALFKQKLSESELATLGSRISAMEVAVSNTEKRIQMLDGMKRNLERGIANRKQLDQLAGISLWGANV